MEQNYFQMVSKEEKLVHTAALYASAKLTPNYSMDV